MDSLKQVARDARNKYRREWYRNNRDKVKAQQERYWLRKAEKLLQAQQAAGKEETQ